MLVLLSTVFAMSFFGTLALRRYALAKNIIDMPNARSSHTTPTPRGGGVAIVLSFLLGLIGWYVWCGVTTPLFWALLPGGVLIALVGFWDDHMPLSARVRLLFHLVAAGWAVFCLGGWATLDLGFVVLPLGWLGACVSVLALAWAINLYNFMDGIDGLAASQAVFVGGAGGALLWLNGADGMPLYLLAVASAGFLLLNWPPARIFMGDAGSGFLGYALGVMVLHSTVSGASSIWPWIILLGVFLVDASLTLFRRAARRIRVTDAHRTHAYQWASRRVGGHRPVTLSILMINLFVLWPAALASMVWPDWAVAISIASLVLLICLAWYFDAGVPEAESSMR